MFSKTNVLQRVCIATNDFAFTEFYGWWCKMFSRRCLHSTEICHLWSRHTISIFFGFFRQVSH